LSDRGIPKIDENGAKQLIVAAKGWRGWTAQVSFAGIARDGYGYDTRAWIQYVARSMPAGTTLVTFIESLAARGTSELSRVTRYDRRLTIIVAVAAFHECSLFLVLNFERLSSAALKSPGANMEFFEADLTTPVVLVNGLTAALPSRMRKRLRRSMCIESDADVLRDHLAAANEMAASQPKFKSAISSGCWVSSLFSNGTCQARNYHAVPGNPTLVADGADFAPWKQNNLRTAPGESVTLIQMASSGGYPLPIELVAPPAGCDRGRWYWEHSETRRAIGEWVPGIFVTNGWGACRYPIRLPDEVHLNQAEARDKNRVIAICVANRFGSEVPPPLNGFRDGTNGSDEASAAKIPIGRFNTLIQFDPNDSDALSCRGNFWYQHGRFENALDDFTSAIKINVANAYAFARRSDTWWNLGQFDNALTDIAEALKLENSAVHFLRRAGIWIAMNELDKALSDYSAAALLEPRSVMAWNGLAWIHATAVDSRYRDGQKATESATKACEFTDWKDGNMIDTLAAAHAETGDFTGAVTRQTIALELMADMHLEPDELELARARLEQYKIGRPWRDSCGSESNISRIVTPSEHSRE